MEAIGSEVGLKMRSAIKAKLMELGCYVDDELPDYVMVMVANKRTRSQMEEDLQLFLANNTEAFVSWLHQVLQKLQEVTISTKLVNSLDHKKIKSKRDDSTSYKKSSKEKEKKKEKEKSKSKQKVKLKSKKAKKEKSRKSPTLNDTKESERIRPNVPRLLMNLEKESSPSITDVFAGQILKSHGITSISSEKVDSNDENKSTRKPTRNIFPIIDPATVSQIEPSSPLSIIPNKNQSDSFDIPSISEIDKLKNENQKSIPIITNNQSKIQDSKKKSNYSTGSGSEEEDFINIRTEAEELIDIGLSVDVSNNMFNNTDCQTPPLETLTKKTLRTKEPIKAPEQSPTELPHIELNLPKRPLRDRLGVKNDITNNNKKAINLVNPYQLNKPEKSTQYDKDNDFTERLSSKIHFEKQDYKSNANDLRNKIPVKQRLSLRETFFSKNNEIKKKIGSRVVPLQNEPSKSNLAVAVASVVRAPPRPQPQGITAAPQLLLRAMADAHKSLLNMPPKVDTELSTKKKALVLPMRRNVNPQKIIIEVPSDNIPSTKCENQDSNSDFEIDMDAESLGELESDKEIRPSSVDQSSEYIPEPLGNKAQKSKPIDYIPTKKKIGIDVDDIPPISKILNPSNDSPTLYSEKDPQFVVTLDGVDPNVFLEKKINNLNTEGEKIENLPLSSNKSLDVDVRKDLTNENKESERKNHKENIVITFNDTNSNKNVKTTVFKDNQNFINTSERKSECTSKLEKNMNYELSLDDPEKTQNILQKKRKASPIIFNKNDTKISKITVKNDSSKDEKSTALNKYDSIPSLLPDGQKKFSSNMKETKCKFFPDCRLGTSCEFYHPPVIIPKQNSLCRAFPSCIYGNKCAYIHPLCKFNASCVRTDCPYSHTDKNKTNATILTLPPAIASRVVPATNFKSVNSSSLPTFCKFYPNCMNPSCHWYHPKPCRYGKHCTNKVECNFYHHDIPSLKWKSSQ